MATRAQKRRAKAKGKLMLHNERPGSDGTVVAFIEARGDTEAKRTVAHRSRPGTFEWKYARLTESSKQGSLYHAGSDFARLWERAGIASFGSFLAAVGRSGGHGTPGMSDARCVALDKVGRVNDRIGAPIMRRLVAYCVEGKTSREIGDGYGIDERRMTHVLAVDLAELARELHYGTVDVSARNP